jgi:type 1 glutamine amidotransferase
MLCWKSFSTVIVLALSILPACFSRADDAPKKVGSAKKLQVLVLFGGHGFPEKPFQEVFASFSDMKCTFVEEKVGGEAFDNIDRWPYDAIVLYNHNKNPSEKRRQNFLKLLDRGVGLVVLHHGLHAYRDWPEFQKMTGLLAFVSDAKDDVDFKIHIEDRQHPIVKGLKDFAVKEETYKGHRIDAKMHVLLTTSEPTNYRAIAWVHTYRNAPVCCLQLGHGESIYGQKEFHTILGNAIRWSAGRLPPH